MANWSSLPYELRHQVFEELFNSTVLTKTPNNPSFVQRYTSLGKYACAFGHEWISIFTRATLEEVYLTQSDLQAFAELPVERTAAVHHIWLEVFLPPYETLGPKGSDIASQRMNCIFAGATTGLFDVLRTWDDEGHGRISLAFTLRCPSWGDASNDESNPPSYVSPRIATELLLGFNDVGLPFEEFMDIDDAVENGVVPPVEELMELDIGDEAPSQLNESSEASNEDPDAGTAGILAPIPEEVQSETYEPMSGVKHTLLTQVIEPVLGFDAPYEFHFEVSDVSVVKKLTLCHHTRRFIIPETLNKITASCVCLEHLVWPTGTHSSIKGNVSKYLKNCVALLNGVPASVKTFHAAETKCLWRAHPSMSIRRALAKAAVKVSEQLEELSLEYLADAEEFFYLAFKRLTGRPHLRPQWPALRSLYLTARNIDPTFVHMHSMFSIIVWDAEVVAEDMPVLDKLLVWNETRGFLGGFQYSIEENNPSASAKFSFHRELDPTDDMMVSWRHVAEARLQAEVTLAIAVHDGLMR